ncbi:hypothetical protein FQR65_LT08221 [Abscondita terminalis]|nr:hypothetical protein FQR65_LT08221 [Abscondita terminalis]
MSAVGNFLLGRFFVKENLGENLDLQISIMMENLEQLSILVRIGNLKAPNTRDAKRRQLQVIAKKRKNSASVLSKDKQNEIVALENEDTPEGLQREVYHIVVLELVWRGDEAAESFITNNKLAKAAFIKEMIARK